MHTKAGQPVAASRPAGTGSLPISFGGLHVALLGKADMPPARVDVRDGGVRVGLHRMHQCPDRRTDPLISFTQADHLQAVLVIAQILVLGRHRGQHPSAQARVTGAHCREQPSRNKLRAAS